MPSIDRGRLGDDQRVAPASMHATLQSVPLDTSPEALRAQTLAQRQLGGPRRFRLACEMSQAMRRLHRARIVARRPELDEQGILDEMMRELYGFRRDS
jgi:hypothetical protein